MSEVAVGKLLSILRLEVSQLSKHRVSDFGTIPYPNVTFKVLNPECLAVLTFNEVSSTYKKPQCLLLQYKKYVY